MKFRQQDLIFENCGDLIFLSGKNFPPRQYFFVKILRRLIFFADEVKEKNPAGFFSKRWVRKMQKLKTGCRWWCEYRVYVAVQAGLWRISGRGCGEFIQRIWGRCFFRSGRGWYENTQYVPWKRQIMKKIVEKNNVIPRKNASFFIETTCLSYCGQGIFLSQKYGWITLSNPLVVRDGWCL